ncbi:MAG TPA: CotH kinase family protein [Bacteroidales bacterium]|nr:CotH kinase family protein [Bacteroidales bacterium]HPT03073.1 CotH kinase family protein [Bacteroidales bacterium]
MRTAILLSIFLCFWSTLLTAAPEGDLVSFTSSNLPIVIINTHGLTIKDDPKIKVDLGIIDNGPGVRNNVSDPLTFSGYCGIEIRGSSSQSFPKKSYGFETWNAIMQTVDTSLMGMPSESDWILNANYSDKTLCRNTLAYQTWMNMGHYATRYRHVELVINGEYQGIYIFSEKIKRDKNRVDISKLKPDDITGDQLTGGYIIKIDKTTGSGGGGWTSNYLPLAHPSGQTIYFQYEYPKDDEIVEQQKYYIQQVIDTFETVLASPYFSDTLIGFRKYASENKLIDYFLVNEISKNVDGYRLSTYFYKDRKSKGGKLKMGPVWDYDIAWHNADYCGGDLYSGWAYQFPCMDDYYQVPFWWGRLFDDALFKDRLKCRWQLLRQTYLSEEYIDGYIDSIASGLDEAQARNFIKWPILGVYVWPNPQPIPATYAGEIESLKAWIGNRLNWMEAHLPGTCSTTAIAGAPQAEGTFASYPNPVSGVLTLEIDIPAATKVTGTISTIEGREIMRFTDGLREAGFSYDQVNMQQLKPGMYLLKVIIGNTVHVKKIVKS